MTNRDDLLKFKGRLWVLDEKAAVKKFVEVTVIDSVKTMFPLNRTEIKTPSGITVYETADPDAKIEFDFYHPGNNYALDLLFRGPVNLTKYDGSTAVTGEKAAISFKSLGDCAVIPGFNGAKTAATITSVKSLDGATTYTVTTDYTVSADALTGMTLITHVSGGTIPLNTDVVVTYTYTPSKSQQLNPSYAGTLIDRFLVLDSIDPSDSTKYRRYYLPRATATSELEHSLLDIGSDNANPNILKVSMQLAKPDVYTNDQKWYIIDTVINS